MNDVTRRFGFSPSPAHGRVPGPYTPLQDEPQDAGDICTAVGANTKTVPVPQIQSMKAVSYTHLDVYKRQSRRSDRHTYWWYAPSPKGTNGWRG